MSTEPILGIDLGTTNSAIAFLKDGMPTIIPIGNRETLPSVVGISPNREVLVGQAARNQWVISPNDTVRSIKRKMGSGEAVVMGSQEYAPQEISAFILKELKRIAEAHLGQPVQRAVITVPAYFNELQRQATLEAGEIAGFTVERIINEPTAAAMAYGLSQAEENLQALVYDLGGGTFDISLIELQEGVVNVLATAGNNQLGGDDLDTLLARELADRFKAEHHIDLEQDALAWSKLLRAAEDAKITLSSDTVAVISLEYVATSEKGVPLHIRQEVSRAEFEDIIEEKLEETLTLMSRVLEDADQKIETVDQILLVGGSTRIPAVFEKIRERFHIEPQHAVDPDTAVALGAAVQGGIINGEAIQSILIDVTPYSLGIESAENGITGHLQTGVFTRLIHRNTTIPARISKEFNTLYPGQTTIEIKVYQGEHALAEKNVLLGEFLVTDLKPNTPWGITEVTVEFSLNVSGILDVAVLDRKSNLRVTRQLKASHERLSAMRIASSKAKLESLFEESRLDEDFIVSETEITRFDAETQALLHKAQSLLSQGYPEPEEAKALTEAISSVLDTPENAQAMEDALNRLVDLLMRMEEKQLEKTALR